MESRLADPTMHVVALRHFEADRLAAAAAACEVILDKAPRDWLALRLLGHIRNKEHAFDQAARLFAAALQASPPNALDMISMLNGLGEALRGLGDFVGTLDCYRCALLHDPRDAITLQNHGSTLLALNRHAEALEQYRLALTVTPDSADLQLNEAIAMLALGIWPQGWERLEARLSIPRLMQVDRFPDDVPHWRGDSDIAGKSILLQAEQGLGDTIQFIRYVPLVAARGARVFLRVQPLLGKLLTGLAGTATVMTSYDVVPAVDAQCPIMSLPRAFGTTLATVPAAVPYLRPSLDYLMLWKTLLGPRRRKRIGVAWSGRQHLPLRSLPLASLTPVLTRPDLEFHALQKEVPAADRGWLEANCLVVDHSPVLKDFADTAALVSQMDLVLSIDTSVAHLAGALGIPVWIMLPFSADWRWLIDRTDTVWYPTARLFRQKLPGDWDGVVAEVAQALSV